MEVLCRLLLDHRRYFVSECSCLGRYCVFYAWFECDGQSFDELEAKSKSKFVERKEIDMMAMNGEK